MVNVSQAQGTLVLTPAAHYALEALVDGINASNLHVPDKEDTPKGNEEW
jgi:hypothetical protein